MILIDSREQNAPYVSKQFTKSGIESEIVCLPQETGADYLIAGLHGSVAIQRKVVVSEMISELDEIMYDIIPRLKNFSDNPVLLLEENISVSPDGYIMNRNDGRPTDMLITSYYGYLQTLQKMGIDVVTTRDIHQSIWYMIAMHGYLSKEHYPKHKKYFSVQEQAIGMLTAIPTIGEARAKKALQKMSIRAMAGCTHIDGLTEKQSGKLQDVMRYKI